MQEFKVQGKDGEIGSVHGFLFKDDSWRIAYIVVDAGKLLSGHKAIIPPAALESCDQVKKKLSVSLRKKQVKNGPDIDSDKPVSRQKEIELNRYYGWPMPGIALPAADMPSVHGLVPAPESREGRPSSVDNDTNLRSTREIIGYRIEASHGTVGEVEGFLVDDESWTIRYVIVSLGKPLHGKQVL
ncbi:MAG: PRC-barrel domain containing protein, partial [Thermoplasmata archaeon]